MSHSPKRPYRKTAKAIAMAVATAKEGNDLVSHYMDRVLNEISKAKLPTEHLIGTARWAEDEITEISHTAAQPFREESEFELKRVLEEVRERLGVEPQEEE